MGNKSISNDKLDSIIRDTSFDTPENANASLKEHGLSAKMTPGQSSADIYEGDNKVASVEFEGSDNQVSNISY